MTPPLEAGRALDAMIAEKVMGWTWVKRLPEFGTGVVRRSLVPRHSSRPPATGVEPITDGTITIPDYSTDLNAAWLVVEKTREREFLGGVDALTTACEAWFSPLDDADCFHHARTGTAPHAICVAALAALAAVGSPSSPKP